ncbi:MAG: DNA replication protein DnaC [Planctomycetaceae bacterium]|jgi:DNA replication protein DnaC
MLGEYIDKRENILLVGNSGTGKTHVAIALAIAACDRGRRVRFYRVTELITQLMEAREERVLLRLKAQLAKLDLLILDELGHVPAIQFALSASVHPTQVASRIDEGMNSEVRIVWLPDDPTLSDSSDRTTAERNRNPIR